MSQDRLRSRCVVAAHLFPDHLTFSRDFALAYLLNPIAVVLGVLGSTSPNDTEVKVMKTRGRAS